MIRKVLKNKERKIPKCKIEGSNDPIWEQRVLMLHKLFDKPMPISEILTKAQIEYKWKGILTTHVLAFGDGSYFFASATGYQVRNRTASEIEEKEIRNRNAKTKQKLLWHARSFSTNNNVKQYVC
ncbi:MAG: hypothetical protein WC942_05140 [Clostridia bacterium]|jgi:hypothetical protein